MMAFVGSVSYLASGQVTVALPTMTDLSGNSPGSQCYYSHVQINSPGTVTSVVTFDNKPGVNYTSLGEVDCWAIPVGARTMIVTPTGGNATVELGQSL